MATHTTPPTVPSESGSDRPSKNGIGSLSKGQPPMLLTVGRGSDDRNQIGGQVDQAKLRLIVSQKLCTSVAPWALCLQSERKPLPSDAALPIEREVP